MWHPSLILQLGCLRLSSALSIGSYVAWAFGLQLCCSSFTTTCTKTHSIRSRTKQSQNRHADFHEAIVMAIVYVMTYVRST